MHNFTIRPIKHLITISTAATVIINESNTQSTILKANTEIIPLYVDHGKVVRFEANGFHNVTLPLEVFIHVALPITEKV